MLKGEIPLVIDVDNADIMITLIKLKQQIEEVYQSLIKMAFSSAPEAYLIADEIGQWETDHLNQ